ncbi:MAG: phenylalanine--tRNA ligase subunit beta, partial [Candidatus Geothermarchaeales archaeon]
MGKTSSLQELVEKIPYIGVSLEDVRPKEIKIEYNPNRPDLGIITGVAKAYNGITRHRTGLVPYATKEGGYQLNVEESVEPVRPHVIAAVVRKIRMEEDALKDIIALQEDLHQTMGRSRRKVSIGLHNLDVVNFPVLYRAVGPSAARFVPLDQDEEMTCEDILEKLETGRKYGPILGDKYLCPLIVDDQQNILSFPPIINSEFTRIGADTSDLFIDVTGTDLPRMQDSLNILVTSLADYGAEIFHVDVRPGQNSIQTPDLSTRRMKVNVGYIKDLLGLDLEEQEIVECLEASRLGASASGGELRVEIPPYRADIMHPIDIVEDVAIGYGYWRIVPDVPKTFSLGKSLDSSRLERRICQLMEGAGFIEVMNFTLSSLEKQFTKLALKPEAYLRVRSPKS